MRNKTHTMMLPVGARVVVEPTESTLYASVKEFGADKGFRVRYIHLSKYVTGFKNPPSFKTLEKYLYDGIATTPTGARTEPDGTDPDGFPSWIMAMGFI